MVAMSMGNVSLALRPVEVASLPIFGIDAWIELDAAQFALHMRQYLLDTFTLSLVSHPDLADQR